MLHWHKFVSIKNKNFFLFDHQFLVCKYCLENVEKSLRSCVGDLDRVARVSVNPLIFSAEVYSQKQYLFSKFH